MKPNKDSLMDRLLHTLPQIGQVTWIGVRPARHIPLVSLPEVTVSLEDGLAGDHYQSGHERKRQVTLIQAEHLTAIASLTDQETIDPGLLRRNIVVKGINLLALKDRKFRVGQVLLEMTGLCHPCSRMEENLGSGGYNAVRGHGGITGPRTGRWGD
ncbi:MAG: MOSC domain-containing protein [Bacteroidia bacterium]|nr:MOSC domain-containing protein [Bacteroidia bacterium]